MQLVLSCLVPNAKPAILRVNSFPIFYSQIYSKLVFCLVSCETVYLIQSEPELTDQVTEAMFVFIPGAVEINGAIHSLLDHCPSPTSCCMVTIYIEGAWTIWVDCVNTADPSTGFVQLSTVFSYWRLNKDTWCCGNALKQGVWYEWALIIWRSICRGEKTTGLGFFIYLLFLKSASNHNTRIKKKITLEKLDKWLNSIKV